VLARTAWSRTIAPSRSRNADGVLDADIDQFIEAYLMQADSRERLIGLMRAQNSSWVWLWTWPAPKILHRHFGS